MNIYQFRENGTLVRSVTLDNDEVAIELLRNIHKNRPGIAEMTVERLIAKSAVERRPQFVMERYQENSDD